MTDRLVFPAAALPRVKPAPDYRATATYTGLAAKNAHWALDWISAAGRAGSRDGYARRASYAAESIEDARIFNAFNRIG